MPHDVTTRWNSTFDMLDFALRYQKPLQIITSNLNLNLWQYELSKEEWKTAEQLRDVLKVLFSDFSGNLFLTNLKVFKDATMFFSQSKPNIDSVIPATDYLDQQLTASALNPKHSASIKASITLGKKTLNRYYDMTDHSEIYRIAMGNLIYYFSYCITPSQWPHPVF
jgi:hypothetical protein